MYPKVSMKIARVLICKDFSLFSACWSILYFSLTLPESCS